MIREIHVFGTEVGLGQQHDNTAQHMGYGGNLLKEAERIAQEEFRSSKIAIISGVGVRNYFRSEFGYRLEGAYMTKDLC
jgi:elongator complex protein 3